MGKNPNYTIPYRATPSYTKLHTSYAKLQPSYTKLHLNVINKYQAKSKKFKKVFFIELKALKLLMCPNRTKKDILIDLTKF